MSTTLDATARTPASRRVAVAAAGPFAPLGREADVGARGTNEEATAIPAPFTAAPPTPTSSPLRLSPA